jgi:hypothetical protein
MGEEPEFILLQFLGGADLPHTQQTVIGGAVIAPC